MNSLAKQMPWPLRPQVVVGETVECGHFLSINAFVNMMASQGRVVRMGREWFHKAGSRDAQERTILGCHGKLIHLGHGPAERAPFM